ELSATTISSLNICHAEHRGLSHLQNNDSEITPVLRRILPGQSAIGKQEMEMCRSSGVEISGPSDALDRIMA
ncbi:MAG: hypothetical protein AABZ24_09115, partial [Nitrospirota bacterium]